VPSIGVAIAVPEPWAEQLRRHRLSFGDDQADSVPTHVTLLPPVEVDDHQLEQLEKHLADAARTVEPFEIHLRGTGTFRPVSPVVFVALARGISEVELLAEAVRSGMPDLPLAYPFHPHVTVAHHVPDAALDQAFEELAGFECSFPTARFALFLHDPARGWVNRSAFELGTGDMTFA
jgi:2'-5' RNA ligase